MLGSRVFGRFSVSALGAIAFQTLVAGEPAATPPQPTPPPATSIREWKSTTNPATPAPTAPATSIREWKTTPSPTPGACPTASPIANVAAAPAATSPAKPPARAAAATIPVTISFKSSLREGNLVVLLDDVPIFNEEFHKPLLLISQTTTWNPLQVPAGSHRLAAKVYGTKKTYFSKDYDLHLPASKAADLRFVMQGDKLTVALGS